LIHHCGSDPRGGFCYTLSAVEINAAWTELRVLRNKAQTWTLRALVDIERTVPFRIHNQYVDNGPEYRILAKLMPLISTKHNYFMPTMKLIKKTRIGGKVHRKYAIDTPMKKLLNSKFSFLYLIFILISNKRKCDIFTFCRFVPGEFKNSICLGWKKGVV